MMMRMRFPLALCVLTLLTMGILFTQTGCEEASGLSGLQVDPSSVTLSTNDSSVVLSVVGGITNNVLALPLEWEVSDLNLGRITAHSGTTAVYRRSSPNGVNTVTVRDQFANEGYVTITQRDVQYSFRLVADPTSIRPNEGSTIRIEGDDAQPPFSWQLVSGPGFLSGAPGSSTASYSAGTGTGVAQISVTDANGVSASVSISVSEDAAAPGNGNGPADPGDPDLGF